MNERLLQVFLGELDEHVGALNRELLRLESAAGTDPECLKSLFRTAHSLKGASRTLSLGEIETVSHHLEEIFAALRDGPLQADAALIQLLLSAADALADASRRLRAGEALEAGPLPALPPALTAALITALRQDSRTKPAKPGKTAVATAAAVPPEAAPPQAAPTVDKRLPADLKLASAKLDSILARSAELAIARHRIDHDARLLEQMQGELQRQRKRWDRVARELEGAAELGQHPVAARLLREARAEAAGLRQAEQKARRVGGELFGGLEELGRVGAALDEDVLRVRMVPFATVCEGFERLVRDIATGSGKQAQLFVEGGGVEVDRAVLEGLRDPLQHLVQNAVFHGIEPGDERRRQGKPERGRVALAAAMRGERVEISVADDGRGLNLPAIREAALRRGLPDSGDDATLMRTVFVAGLTTAQSVNPIAGRGVGLDIVQAALQSLRGTVDVASAPGQGARFTLSLPLTLTNLRAVLVEAGGHRLGIDGGTVVRLSRLKEADLHRSAGRTLLAFDGSAIPVAGLAELLGATTGASAGAFAVIGAGNGGQRAAFLVDALLAEQKVTIQPLGPRLEGIGPYAGATVLPGGEVVPILDMAKLVARALSQSAALAAVPSAAAVRARLLVAHDSVTIRTLQKNVLEAAGYEVAVATNGGEAWRMLQEHGADLLVSDVEMPELDGFSLTETIRGSERFRDLPVILVTTRSSDEDKARGMRAGADAYLIKSAYDQNELLETIRQLI